MARYQNFTRPELAAIYRQLNPSRSYLGDPPEAWFRDVLIKAILTSLTVPIKELDRGL